MAIIRHQPINHPREILPLLYRSAVFRRRRQHPAGEYPGYPLVAGTDAALSGFSADCRF